MISLHDWDVIRSLARSGVPKAQIARDLGLARNTVARAVRADSQSRYQRSGRGSCFDAYETKVGSLLQETSRMSAMVIAEWIGEPGQSNRLRRLLADSGWLDLNNANGSLDVRGVRLEFSGVNDPHGRRDRYVGFESGGSSSLGSSGGAGRSGQGGEVASGEVTRGDGPHQGGASAGGSGRAGVTRGGVPHRGEVSAGEGGFSNEYLRATGRSVRLGLSHAPYARVLNQFLTDGTDLVFCGHTHGGQVCLPGGHALVTNCDLDPQFASGLFEWQADTCHGIESGTGKPDRASMSVCVSPGLGTSPFTPWRVFCPPVAYIVELVAA
ncbi:hypothetical protein [uncultured Mobiluncus sp.]|uniref:hypothetical protein n=1 Tax=uncultured Mobiluncus sp. TaxID=293425 RepID=UPI002621DC09|nr:hypothetical protein [uncultured Mobiluncus sp.]